MNIDFLPSQLHLNYRSKIDISPLLTFVENIFPDMGNAEISDDTLNLYEPREHIEFIHVSTRRIGIIFSENITTLHAEEAWKDVAKILSELQVSKMQKYTWEYKLVKLFKSKSERDAVAKRLSPVKDYIVKALTLYPEGDLGYFVRLSMVSKDKKEHGIMLNFTHEVPKISLKEVPQTLMGQVGVFDSTDKTEALIDKVLGK